LSSSNGCASTSISSRSSALRLPNPTDILASRDRSRADHALDVDRIEEVPDISKIGRALDDLVSHSFTSQPCREATSDHVNEYEPPPGTGPAGRFGRRLGAMEPWLAELHRSEDRLRAVIESSPLAIMEVDLEMRVIRWNRAAERIFGWMREEMLGRSGTPMVPPSEQAEHEELVARVRAGESYTGHQTVRRRKDGTVFEVMMAAAPVHDATGRVVSHVVVYNDNSETKQQEERLQALIDSSPLALVEFGVDTRVRLWNPAAERIFGWSREEMLGRGDLPMAPSSKRAESEELFVRVRAGESLNDYETVRQRKDGTLVDVSIAAAPIRDGSGHVAGNMVAYTDITERKAQAAEVHRLNAELHARLEELAASRARIVTAGDVERRRLERNLHDGAQQRLVTLSLSLRRALAKLDSDPTAARATLVDASDELALALDELRELARGLHPAVLSDHGLRAAVEGLAGRVPVPVEIADIPDDRLPEPIEAGAYYLIAEALTNVTKYAQASTVRVRVAASDASFVVEVSDDGVGGADPTTGSGLRGLADRVEALGGSLEVVSPAGAGTSLRAEIPITGPGVAGG
jgi:PAS domain S-box-containing protein